MYYYTINYDTYLYGDNETEFAFRVYVYNVNDDIRNSYYYIGTVFVSKLGYPYPYRSRIVDHYAYGIISPVVSDVDTVIAFGFANSTEGAQMKKVVFENIAFY